ncbi:MAG TPA: AAA family ATPase [Spirochaetales bacterium]|nr:AAA family ATPase [Spirochaetales bacterium]
MRPARLDLKNIGPFPGAVSVDFSSLGDVFLVCGPTGSGKTTLFEAMAYALYGQLPGTRDVREIASHYASPDDDVGVSFEFSVGRGTWKVERSPGRRVAKKKGEGFTERPALAALWRRDGGTWVPVCDKVTDVDAAVAELLGLSAEEFSKIVLLPQGQFQRFLEMDQKERADILEKLFPVELHASVSALAMDALKAARQSLRALDEELSDLDARLGDDAGARLADMDERAASARHDEGLARAVLETAALASEAGRRDLAAWDCADRARALLAGLQERSAAMRDMANGLERAEAAAGIRAELDAERRAAGVLRHESAALEAAHARLAELDGRHEAMADTGRRLDGLAAEVAELDRRLGELDARRAAWNRAAAARASLKASEEEVARLSDALALDEAAEAGLSEELAGLERRVRDPVTLSKEREAADVAARNASATLAAERDRAALVAELAAASGRLAVLDGELNNAQGARDSALAGLTEAKNLAARMSAVRLAVDLKPGDPCPVCGSLDHPAPALGETEYEGLDRERLEGELLAAEKKLATALERQAAAGTVVDGLRERLSKLADGPGLEAAEKTDAAARQTLDACVAAGRDNSALMSAATEKRNMLARLAAAAKDARAALAKAERDKAAAGASLAEAVASAGTEDPGPELVALGERKQDEERELKAARAALDAWDRERETARGLAQDLDARVRRLVDEHSAFKEAADRALESSGFADTAAWEAAVWNLEDAASARKELRDYETDLAAALADDKAARAQVEGRQRPDMAALDQAYADAEAKLAQARRICDGLALEASALRGDLARHGDLARKADVLRSRSDTLNGLATLLNGDTPGKHLSFRNYALGLWFSQVMAMASARLRDMSDGRYDLRMAEGRARGQGRVGLDIEVADAFTGKARPASSLSGGEKFLSSISLALGLSDVITQGSGGVALDSIFIDEGFGSLDEDALDRAMAALDRIRGDRMIGIVSHVAELRDRVPSRIEVRKGRSGSTLEVI